jgi:hypothetical protein
VNKGIIAPSPYTICQNKIYKESNLVICQIDYIRKAIVDLIASSGLRNLALPRYMCVACRDMTFRLLEVVKEIGEQILNK